MVTYGTTAIPSDQINVISGGTVSVSVAFDNSVGLIGGMDTDNGSATPGESVQVRSPSDAQSAFGDGSELHEAVSLAFQNGAGTVHALPVEETEVSAEVQSTQDGALDEAPIFDPRTNSEHEITVEDTTDGTLDVNLVDEPPDSAPSETDTVDIYPPTGEFYADSAPSGDYEFTYDHGDYSTTAFEPLIDESPRIVVGLTESESVTNDLATEVNSRAVNFDFMHVVTGAEVDISDVNNYANGVEERRISRIFPARGFTDDAETEEARTPAAVGGYLASLALGLSSTNDEIGGFTGLKNDLTGPTDAGTLSDENILPLLDYPPVTIAVDNTTATEEAFGRVYAMQIADEITELSHTIARNYVGDQNTEENRQSLRRSHVNAFLDAQNGTPRLLDDFTVSVSENPSDPNQVDVQIGIDIVDVMDTIDITITVGDIIRNEGAA